MDPVHALKLYRESQGRSSENNGFALDDKDEWKAIQALRAVSDMVENMGGILRSRQVIAAVIYAATRQPAQ